MAGPEVVPSPAGVKRPTEGIAVGPGRRSDDGKLVPVDLKVGDKVLYGKYSGTEVSLNGGEYLIMREADIFGIV